MGTPLREWGDRRKVGEDRKAALVFVPFLQKVEMHPKYHQEAFKKLIGDLIRKRSISDGQPRVLNERLFDEIWPKTVDVSEAEGSEEPTMPEKEARTSSLAASLSSTFRTLSVQAALYDDRIVVYPAALNANNLRDFAKKFSNILGNLPVTVMTSRAKEIPVGNLHDLKDIPAQKLKAKLGDVGTQRIVKLSTERFHDLLNELSEPHEQVTDMRYFLLKHVNNIRKTHKLPELALHEEESRNAKTHAEHMLNVGGAVSTPKEFLGEWKEIVAHEDLKEDPHAVAHDILVRRVLMNEGNRKKILNAKTHVAADIAVKDGKLALSMRVK